jgi:hypothetical protein
MNAESIIYFICPCCELVYQSRQARTSECTIGRISCVKCFTTVHSWSGIYDFRSWKPVPTRTTRRSPPAMNPPRARRKIHALRGILQRYGDLLSL